MTIYDLLKDNVAILRRFHKNGVAVDSIRFIPIYEQWESLLAEGHKKQYIEQVLADRFGYNPRYIRMIVKFMQEQVI